MSAYDRLAADYDWLFADEALASGLAINGPAAARMLAGLAPGSAVLDAACGTGIDAAALSRRGFRVWASDASPAMVEQARARFVREGVAADVFQSRWDELPARAPQLFDAVLCLGNSLVHADGRDAMISALRGLASVLGPGGLLAVDSRNWQKLHRERRLVQVHERPIIREGRRCFVLYAWDIPDGFHEDHVAHLVFVFDHGESLEPREHQVTFRPFTREELRDRVREAGLREVDDDFRADADRYSIIARPEPGPPGPEGRRW